MHRTQVRARTSEGYKLLDAIAGVKVAGFTFLIHVSTSSADKFSATYAPIGIGICDYASIGDLVAELDERAELIAGAVVRQVRDFETSYTPLLAAETGIESDSWQYREQTRFDSGEYRAIPSVCGRELPAHHYAHLSVTKTESDFVAYTPNDTYGENDRQVRLKFGKYLRKTFSDMTDAEIQSSVVALRALLALEDAPATLLFTTERSVISEVFETEMYACDSSYVSCMHGKFTGREHRPYHVYADSPDVAVAYLTECGSIVARSVVSTKSKEWVRAYSVKANDSTYCRILTDALERAGYESGDLIGSRLTRLPQRNGAPVLPYIDHGGMGVNEDGKYWEVVADGDGEWTADQTDGTASQNTPKCHRCDNDEDDCSCSYCECCQESYRDGCEECCMCCQCEGCTTHDGCSCVRCSDCSEIIEPTSRYTTRCDCDRCAECGELQNECDCEETETETPVATDCEVHA